MEYLFFIAVVLPQDIRKEVMVLKKIVSENYHSHHAMKSPPHITLHMPFKWKINKKQSLTEGLGQLVQELSPFELNLKNFVCFEPRVIFVNVQETEPLNKLQKQVALFMKKGNVFNEAYKNQAFHPHVTIAFRDLKRAIFVEAWDFFQTQSFDRQFSVNGISLLKHDGVQWEETDVFHFNVTS